MLLKRLGNTPRKNWGIHIAAFLSRQPLVKGERLVRYEVNAVIKNLSCFACFGVFNFATMVLVNHSRSRFVCFLLQGLLGTTGQGRSSKRKEKSKSDIKTNPGTGSPYFFFFLRLPGRPYTVYGLRPAGSPDQLFFPNFVVAPLPGTASRSLVNNYAVGLKRGSSAPRAMATTFFPHGRRIFENSAHCVTTAVISRPAVPSAYWSGAPRQSTTSDGLAVRGSTTERDF